MIRRERGGGEQEWRRRGGRGEEGRRRRGGLDTISRLVNLRCVKESGEKWGLGGDTRPGDGWAALYNTLQYTVCITEDASCYVLRFRMADDSACQSTIELCQTQRLASIRRNSDMQHSEQSALLQATAKKRPSYRRYELSQPCRDKK